MKGFGMRIRYDGLLTPAEFKGEIAALCDDLADLGVEHLSWANLYFTPFRQGRAVSFRTQAGQPLSIVVVEE